MFFDSGVDRRREVRRAARRARLRDDEIGRAVRRRLEIERLEIDDPDRTILAAAIVAALFVPRVVHAVRDAAAVGRDLALIRARKRHRRLDAAFDRHRPEPRRGARRLGRARRVEDDRLSVGRPALDDVGARMPGQSLRLTALRRHDVDVDVPAVLRAERDQLAVGRELWVLGRALEARDAPRAMPPARRPSRCCSRRRTRSASCSRSACAACAFAPSRRRGPRGARPVVVRRSHDIGRRGQS